MKANRSSGTRLVVVAAVAVLATACAADPSAGVDGRSGPTGSDASSESTGSASPSPTGPCADGTCELDVAEGDVVAVPQEYGLGPIEIIAITDTEIEMVAPVTGSGFSISGCAGGGGVTSQGGGGVTLTCAEGTTATVNDAMALKVVDIRDGTAALHITPAE
ncbi:hypothetical protein [Stackebrandtia albiflava]|nr:hypothetical protein [Stackebrandtia albiflava]